MEELKQLVEMVKDVPNMVLWILAGYLFFKLFVIGSIYGLVKLVVLKLHDWLTTPKEVLINKNYEVDSLVISGEFKSLITQLKRVAGKGIGIDSPYMHEQSIIWLSEAITDKEKKDYKESKEDS